MFAEMDAVLRALVFGGLFLLALAAVLWTVYDGQTVGASSGWSVLWWIVGGIALVLIVPALVINAFNLDTNRQNLIDPISYVGIIGTIVAVLASGAYFITRNADNERSYAVPEPIYENTQPIEPMPMLRTEPLPMEEAPEMRTMQLRRPTSRLAAFWITTGPRRGTSFGLHEVTNIGRSGQRNDIILADEAVSSEHARVRFEEERKAFVYYDLASTNGSWLVTAGGKQKIETPHVLADGDIVELGGTALTYKEISETTPA